MNIKALKEELKEEFKRHEFLLKSKKNLMSEISDLDDSIDDVHREIYAIEQMITEKLKK